MNHIYVYVNMCMNWWRSSDWGRHLWWVMVGYGAVFEFKLEDLSQTILCQCALSKIIPDYVTIHTNYHNGSWKSRDYVSTCQTYMGFPNLRVKIILYIQRFLILYSVYSRKNSLYLFLLHSLSSIFMVLQFLIQDCQDF